MRKAYYINFYNFYNKIITVAVPLSKMVFTTTIRPRNRRQVLNDTSNSITVHDVREEIAKQLEQLMPLKYCESSEKICPAGPSGFPGPTGAMGPRGRRGQKGKKGPQGSMGPPGKSGKTGMTGPAGPKWEKGDKGETGPKGMPEPPGRPGKSISVPQVMLSPVEQKGDEGGDTTFSCTVGGNPPLQSNGYSWVESLCQVQSIWLKKESWSLRIWTTAMLGSTHVTPGTFLDHLRPLVTCLFEVRGALNIWSLLLYHATWLSNLCCMLHNVLQKRGLRSAVV